MSIGWLEQTAVYWGYGGTLLIPIALVSLGIWGYFARSREALGRVLQDGQQAADALRRVTADQSPAAALKDLSGGVAVTVRSALADIRRGTEPLTAFTTREAECLSALQQDFVVLAALTAVAPLLGLLGTVAGMIETFGAVAAGTGGTGERVALGISRALITTQFGLVIALPGLFGLARLKRMLRHVEVLLADCRSHAVAVLGATRGVTP